MHTCAYACTARAFKLKLGESEDFARACVRVCVCVFVCVSRARARVCVCVFVSARVV